MNTKNKKIDFSNMPLSSSLGHLAYGDIAFKAWRELKIRENKKNSNEKE